MLPTNRHSQDEKWLSEQFDELASLSGLRNAQAVMVKYSAAYAEVYESEDLGHKKENKARHEANQRLVKLIKSLKARAIQPKA